MEYAKGGELKRYVQSKNGLSESEAIKIMLQIFDAVHYWHQKGIVHRDLKLENVLFADTAKTNIKVVDFGLSSYWHNNNGEITDAGTLKYMAPEVLSGENLNTTKSIDIWSLGIILYALLFNGLPFLGETKEEIMNNIIKQELKLPESYEENNVKLVSKEAEDLLRGKKIRQDL